jgi:hypothetical protein
MTESMYEISLKNGFGPIKFDSPPSAVKNALGEELYYEDWMDGNLENFRYFRELLVGFRGEVTDHPTENSQVCMFQAKTVHPMRLWDQEISSASKDTIAIL